VAAASLRSKFRESWKLPISAAFSSSFADAVSADDETSSSSQAAPLPLPQPPRLPRRPSSSIPPPAKAIRRAGGAGTDAASLASWKRGGGALPALAKGRKGGGAGGGGGGLGAAAGGAAAAAGAGAGAGGDAAVLAWQQLRKLQQLQQQLQEQQLRHQRKMQEMQKEQQRRRRRRRRDAAAAESSDGDDGDGDDDESSDDDERGNGDRSASEDESDSDDDSDEDESHADAVGPAHPFTARAFYVGTPEAEAGLRRLRSAAAAAALPCVWDEAGSVAYCLTPGAIPSWTTSTTAAVAATTTAAGDGEKETPLPPPPPPQQQQQQPPPPPPLSRDTPLPHAARYVAVFGSMGAVVFFNGAGYERALWRALAGGDLSGGGGGKGPLPGAAEKRAGRVVAGRDAPPGPPAPPALSPAPRQPTDDVRLFVCPELRSPLRLNACLPSIDGGGAANSGGSGSGSNKGRFGSGGADALLLRSARPAVVQTVACVAAQSVALHHYESRVDAELASFRSACAGMAATGSFRQGTPKEDLLRAVAANNVMLAAIMGGGSGSGGGGGTGNGGGNSSLDGDGEDFSSSSSSSSFNSTGGAIGVMSRLDVAWEDGEAAAVYEHLREDHEFALRLQNLELKLGFVQENLKYFLELMQARKSDTLEWTIIVLIAAEIGVSLFDMWSKAGGAAAAAVVGSGGGGGIV
jgi:hypothetical protein